MNPPKKRPQKPALPPETLAQIWQTPLTGIPTDVLGSYTGTGLPHERPVQDADDL